MDRHVSQHVIEKGTPVAIVLAVPSRSERRRMSVSAVARVTSAVRSVVMIGLLGT